ncbi:MAG: p-hydroxybenzoic acid efflux pump subunit AaeA [Chloroflexi bacterium]|nr:p-hydroxybenzoic acid efflux pump subunit AaeA [Chloroflexota bacterium]
MSRVASGMWQVACGMWQVTEKGKMKMKKNTKILLLLIAIFVLLLSACGSEETPTPEPIAPVSVESVIAEGHILPARDLMLLFSTRGTVTEILVEEGEEIAQGQVLIRLGDQEQATAALRSAELGLVNAEQAYEDFVRTEGLVAANAWQAYLEAQILRAEAEREWEDLDTDDLQDNIDDAEATVSDREQDLTDAQEDFDKYADLDEDNANRQDAEDDLEAAQEDLNEALRDLEEAHRELDAVRAGLDATLAAEAEAKRDYEDRAKGLDPDQKELLEAQIAHAQAQLTAAQKALDDYELKAPFAGTITDINVEIGQLVGPEQWAVQLADLREFHIETSDLTELEVVKIEVGQVVEIVPDALPDLTLTGQVESIGESFRTQAGDIVYPAHISLDETDPALRWGMTVEVTFVEE